MGKIKRVLRRFDKSLLRGFHRLFRLFYKIKPLRPLLRPLYRFVHAHHRFSAAILTIIAIAGMAVPVLQSYYQDQKYELNAAARALLGDADPDLTKKLKFDRKSQTYQFNAEAKQAALPDGSPISTLSSQIGGSGKDDKQQYSMDAPRDLSKGVVFYDNQMGINFKVIPQFSTLPGETREGHIIYPLARNSGQVAYTVEAGSLKENVVLYESPGDSLSMSYKLDLPKSLEARMIDETGDVGIYSADPALFGKIDYGSSDDERKVKEVRDNSEKTYLAFKIPAPIVMTQGKINQAAVGNIKSHFLLSDSVLTVITDGLDKAQYPLAIDPTVTIDSAAEFGAGTVEDNNMTLSSGNMTRGGLTGGSVPSWSSGGNFTGNAQYGMRSVVYNGFMYVLPGYGDSNNIRHVPLNSDGSLGSWVTDGNPNFVNAGAGSYGATVYNGYIYIAGGSNFGPEFGDVEYAPLNSDGTIGTWNTTSALPTAREDFALVAYGGYMYAVGGYDGTNYLTDVLVTPIKANGTIGSWASTTSFGGTSTSQAHAYNGYLYILGLSNNTTNVPIIQYAPINANGTVGAWTTATNGGINKWGFSTVIYNGYMYVMGGTANGSAGTNVVQYAPINANGSLGTWQTTTGFTNNRYSFGAVAYNGYIYIMGGINSGSYRQDVRYAQINPPGVVATTSFSTTQAFTTARSAFGAVAYNGYMYVAGGTTAGTSVRYQSITSTGAITATTWTAGTALPASRSYHQLAAYNGYMYVVGGAVGGVSTTDVLYTTINSSTGALGGSWTATTSFGTKRDSQGVAVYNGYMYVVGGWDSTASGGTGATLSSVEYAPINSNGTIGTWNTTSSFTTARSEGMVAAYNGYIYLVAGSSDNSAAIVSDVQYAPINSNGTIGTWTATNSLSAARSAHNVVIYNGYIYAVAGRDIGNNNLATIEYAPLNSNGTTGTWATTTSITTARRQAQAVAYNGYMYVLGGNTTSDQTGVQYAPINNGGPGTTGSWSSTTSFTGTRYGAGSFAYNGYMYIFGGYNGSAYNDAQYAPISSNGTVGSWTATSSFITARYGMGSFFYNGYAYVVGGTTNGSTYLNDVQYAPINTTTGALGAWHYTHNSTDDGTTFVSGFTTARYGHHVAVYNGYVYVTGGNNGTAQTGVQFAPLNTNGTVGAWTSTTAFTNGRYGHGVTINGGYIYIAGGQNSGTYYNDVQVAAINSSDGTVGAWRTLVPFVNGRYGIDMSVYNGYIYVTGGYNGTTYYNDTQYAALAPGGDLGPWQTSIVGSSYTTRYVHTSLTYNGYMYVLGGNNGSYTNTVYYAPINVQSRKATYSKILSLGTNNKITSISFTGNLVDGLQNFSYRLGNSTGTFPAEAPREADLSYTCNAGYYVQVFAATDNTTSSVFPDSAGVAAQVSSITVTYDVAGVPVDKRLRHGGYFASEQLQPFELVGCN